MSGPAGTPPRVNPRRVGGATLLLRCLSCWLGFWLVLAAPPARSQAGRSPARAGALSFGVSSRVSPAGSPASPVVLTPSAPRALAGLAGSGRTAAVQATPPAFDPCGPMDVAFVVDTTSSMAGMLANVKAQLPQLIDAVERASGGDYRLALVTFDSDFDPFAEEQFPPDLGGGGVPPDFIYVNERFAPRNRAALTAAVARLQAGYGGANPEISDEAVRTVVECLSSTGRPQDRPFATGFRAAARKVVFLVTDALPAGFDNYYDPVTLADKANVHDVAVQALRRGVQICPIFIPQDEATPPPGYQGTPAEWQAAAQWYNGLVRGLMRDYADTTYGVYTEAHPSGDGVADAMIDAIARCGTFRQSHSRLIFEVTDAAGPYAAFTAATGALEAAAAQPAQFPLQSVTAGTVTAAHLRRVGSLERRSANAFEVTWGARTVPAAPGATPVTDFGGPTATLQQGAAKPYPYAAGWHLSGALVADLSAALAGGQASYPLLFVDRLSGLCDNYFLADTPRLGAPPAAPEGRLTLLVKPSYGNPRLPQGGSLRLTIPDPLPDPTPSVPAPAPWQVVFDGVVIASYATPNGWTVTPESSVYKGVTVTAPASASNHAPVVATGYELRYDAANAPGGGNGAAGDTRAGVAVFDVVGPDGSPDDFAVSVRDASLTAAHGTKVSTVVTVTGATHPVNLWLAGLPKGFTYAYTPPRTDGTGSSADSQLEIFAPADAAPGAYTVRAVGVWRDVVREATFQVVVPAPPANPGIDLVVEPASLALLPGQEGEVAATVTARPGFTGQVALKTNPTPGVAALPPAPFTVNLLTGPQTRPLRLRLAADRAPTGGGSPVLLSVTAERTAYPNYSDSELLSVSVLAGLRLNAGGAAYAGGLGQGADALWAPDGTAAASGGAPGVWATGGEVYSGTTAVADTGDPALYGDGRQSVGANAADAFTYAFALPLANMPSRLTLHFAELSATLGQRRFHVDVNGQRVLTNFDVYAEAQTESNPNQTGRALAITLPVVSGIDKKVTVRFTPVAGRAQVAALDLRVAAETDQPAVPPSGLTATGGDGKVTLTWQPVPGVYEYVIRRGTAAGGPYRTIHVGGYGGTWTDTAVTNGTAYYYVVRAVQPGTYNGGGGPGGGGTREVTPASAEASATPHPGTPEAPAFLQAVPGDKQVQLTWQAAYSPSGTPAYYVRRSAGDNAHYADVAGPLAGTAFTDANLRNGTLYHYRVYAVANGQRGPDSNEVSAQPYGPGLRIDAGNGQDYTSPVTGVPWLSDRAFAGGTYGGFLAGTVANTPDGALYLNYRRATGPGGDGDWGEPGGGQGGGTNGEFTYTLDAGAANAPLTLRLHFVEGEKDPGQRRFDVYVNGRKLLDGLDVCAEAGGKYKALVKSLPAISGADGKVVVRFVSQASSFPQAAMVSALELLPPGGGEVGLLECGQIRTGSLDEADAVTGLHPNPVGPGSYFTDLYTFSAVQGEKVTVTLRSTPAAGQPPFNPFLYLVGPNGAQPVASNDDVGTGTGGGTGGAVAATYDAVADLGAANPSGVWSYGGAATLAALDAGGFTPYAQTGAFFDFEPVTGLVTWRSPSQTLPCVSRNATAGTLTYVYGIIMHPPDVLNLHPGPGGEVTAVRFTAPATALYRFTGRFQGIPQNGFATHADVHVRLRGADLAAATLTGPSASGGLLPVAMELPLRAGEPVDFVVGAGPDGYAGDSTGLALTAERLTNAAYDAVGGFSEAANPGTGAWTYGGAATLAALDAGGFVPFNQATRTFDGHFHDDLRTWRWDTGRGLPCVSKNAGAQTITYNNNVINQPPDLLNLHPGGGGEVSVVRFTAPAAGTYRFAGRFQAVPQNGYATNADVHVRTGTGAALLDAAVLGASADPGERTRPFVQDVTLAAGQYVDFVVGYGPDTTFAGDSTGLSVTAARLGAAGGGAGGGADLNPWDARIVYTVPTTGTYTVVATSSPLYAPGVGNYALSLDCVQDDVTPPASPTGLRAQAVPNRRTNVLDRVELSWADNSRDETGFEVERAPVVGGVTQNAWAKVGEAGPNAAAAGRFTDGSVQGEQVYAYRVRAKRVSPDGSRTDYSANYTNEARVSTYAVPPVVSIQYPLEGAQVAAGAVSVKLAASASDGQRVSRLNLYADGALAGSLDVAAGAPGPYTLPWAAANGPHFLVAEVVDTNGLVNASPVVGVQVGPVVVGAPVIRPAGFFPANAAGDPGPPVVELSTATPEAAIWYRVTYGGDPGEFDPGPGAAVDAQTRRYAGPFALFRRNGKLPTVRAVAVKAGVWSAVSRWAPAPFENGQGGAAYGVLQLPGTSFMKTFLPPDGGGLPGNAGPSPQGVEVATGAQPVVGAVAGHAAAWSLAYRSADQGATPPVDAPDGWRVLQAGAGGVAGQVLAEFDPTMLPNGLYELRLRVTNTAGQDADTFRTVLVAGGQKVGPMQLSLTDLTLPAPGFPVQVTRSYDSTDKRRGDFGVGWRAGVSNIRVDKTATVTDPAGGAAGRASVFGYGWTEMRTAIATYYLRETEPHYVTASLPGGGVYGFYAEVTPDQSQLPYAQLGLWGNGGPRLRFKPIPGSQADREGATLYPLDAGGNPIMGGEPVAVVNVGDRYDPNAGNPAVLYRADEEGNPLGEVYDANRFLLTTRDGTRYVIDGANGVERVTDRNGNTVEFVYDGAHRLLRVVSSRPGAGGGLTESRRVEFARNAAGYVQSVTDGRGKPIVYTYQGDDLVGVTNRTNATTTYVYDAEHNLVEVRSPQVTQADGSAPVQPSVRNHYDNQGRLVATADGRGRGATTSHYPAARRTVVTDPAGNQTLVAYDDLGNVYRTAGYLKTTENNQPVTRTVESTAEYGYFAGSSDDEKRLKFGGLKTRQEVQTGRAADGARLRSVTLFEYDDRGDLGQPDRYGKGDLIAVSDPRRTDPPPPNGVGYAQRMRYNALGQVLTVTDARNRVTVRNEYDAAGNLIVTQDGLGNATVYTDGDPSTPDDNLTPDGQPTKVIDAAGKVTRFAYRASDGLPEKVTSAAGTAQEETTEFFYDANGRKTGQRSYRKTDAQGNPIPAGEPLVTTYLYDDEGRLLRTYAPEETGGSLDPAAPAAPTQAQTVYNEAGKVKVRKDGAGRETKYVYDDLGQLVRTVSPDGRTSQTEYDENGRAFRSVDPGGRISETRFDSLGRAVQTVSKQDANDPNPVTSTSLYDDAGRVVETRETLGRVTGRSEYDAAGNQIASYDGFNHKTESHFDEAGRNDWVKDARGFTTFYTYDDAGRVTKVTRDVLAPGSGGAWTETKYDTLGRRIQETVQERALQGNEPAGSNLRITAYGYDDLGRLARVTQVMDPASWPGDPSGKNLVTTYQYDEAGNKVAQTDSNGHTTRFGYDRNGRMVWRKLPLGQTERMHYRPADGRLDYKIDMNGRKTAFVYDAATGRLTAKYPVALVNGAEAPDPDEPGVAYTYIPSGPNQGRKETATYGNVRTRYGYDARGRLLAATTEFVDGSGHARRVQYDYDLLGNKAGMTAGLWDPAGGGGVGAWVGYPHATGYGYDAADRLQAVQHLRANGAGAPVPDGQTTYTYNEVGSVASVARPNQVTTTYLYDGLNALKGVAHVPPGTDMQPGTPSANRLGEAQAFGYTTDLTGRRTALYAGGELGWYTNTQNQPVLLPQDGSQTGTAYGYDPAGRLVREEVRRVATVNGSPVSRVTTYEYDKVGNRLMKTVAQPGQATVVTTYAYDENDRLITEQTAANGTTTDTKTYAYNPDGSVAAMNGVPLAYTFEGRLHRSGPASGDHVEYDYDAEGNRIGLRRVQMDPTSQVGAHTVDTLYYAVDTSQPYAEVVAEWWSHQSINPSELSFTWRLVARYDIGLDRLRMDRPDQNNYGTGQEGVYYYLFDGLGSTRALAGADGVRTDGWGYDAFGTPTHGLGNTLNAFLFNGQQWDEPWGSLPGLEGLYFLRARYYQPGAGRFTTQDAYSGVDHTPSTLHRYRYTGNDPVNYIDPSGNFDTAVGALASITIGSAGRTTEGVKIWAKTWAALRLAGALALVGATVATVPGDDKEYRIVWRFSNFSDPASFIPNLFLAKGLGPNGGKVWGLDYDRKDFLKASMLYDYYNKLTGGNNPNEVADLFDSIGDRHVQGETKFSPFLSVTTDWKAALQTSDPVLQRKMRKAPHIVKFRVPKRYLLSIGSHWALSGLANSEGELLYTGTIYGAFLIGYYDHEFLPNPVYDGDEQ